MLTWHWFASFWSAPELSANLVVFLNIAGALLLGLLVGYERSYHGRAAGMRTYGMVCMASAALTVFSGYPAFWFGGAHGQVLASADPTRVVQGIVTGIGFLGAGVIMKEGLNISGLTTAASIWASSVIGILVGVGFYGAGMLLAVLSTVLMVWGSRIEAQLPSRHAVSIHARFRLPADPTEARLRAWLAGAGYELARDSVAICRNPDCVEWNFVAVALGRQQGRSLPELSALGRELEGLDELRVSRARN